MSIERRKMLRLLGAELELTPAPRGMSGAIQRAEQLLKEIPNSVMPQQFSNPANPDIHRKTTAEEIIKDCDGKLDYFLAGVGTAGTITGVGEVLKAKIPGVKVIAIEPEDSPVISGGQPGPHKIQGIGAGFIPDNLNRAIIDEVLTVSNANAFSMARKAARVEGMPVGISSGGALAAACEAWPPSRNGGQANPGDSAEFCGALLIHSAVRGTRIKSCARIGPCSNSATVSSNAMPAMSSSTRWAKKARRSSSRPACWSSAPADWCAPLLLYLGAAGVGTLGVVDDDTVDLSNLQRQVIHDETTLGLPKVASAQQRLAKLNPDVKVVPHQERLNAENVERLIGDYDIIADGSDNFRTRYLLNDTCFKLKKTLVSAALLRFDGRSRPTRRIWVLAIPATAASSRSSRQPISFPVARRPASSAPSPASWAACRRPRC